jgi:ABC-2 type transport system permease protein
MEYKMNFVFEIFIDAIYYGSLFFFFKIIFQFVDALGDFNQDAVIIFLITMYIADSLYVFFLGGNVFEVNDKVKSGDLDFILLKPVNSQFFISCRYVNTYALVSICILSFLLLKLTYVYHDYQFLLINYIFYDISLILGMFIFYSFEFMIACLVFWFRNFSHAGWLAGELIKYSRRPDSIFKKWFRKALFSIFPMALICSVPSRILLFGPNLKLIILQFFVAILFLALTVIVWKRGLYRYESASS